MIGKQICVGAILLASTLTATAQISEKLKKEVIETGYIHRPLPLDESKSFEHLYANHKKVIDSRIISNMDNPSRWVHTGVGKMSFTAEYGRNSLRMESSVTPDNKPDWGMGLGTCKVSMRIDREDWTSYNRIKVSIYPTCPGSNSIYLNLLLNNDGVTKVPDKFGREGCHEINLKNNQWNECYVEIPSLSRDCITSIGFAAEVFGREESMQGNVCFDIAELELQTVENPETAKGWMPAKERIIYSSTGYRPVSKKTAIVNVQEHTNTYYIRNAETHEVVYQGTVMPVTSQLGKFHTIDFSSVTKPGTYYIEVGYVKSLPFLIHENVWEDSAWRTLNFLFVERCGYPVPSKHGSCHHDLHATYQDKVFPLNGGWHDAADMSQLTAQTGETMYALLQMAENARNKGNEPLYNRLMEEALWGLDFVLRCRLGDGYRAQRSETNLWNDGIMHTADDEGRHVFSISNGALENFMAATYEAYASLMIEHDDNLRQRLVTVAEEDYSYAMARFNELGYEELKKPSRGHIIMTSESQYHAHMSIAASTLYRLTGKQQYADDAAKAIELTLQCQRTEPLKSKDKLSGFFYRDLSRKSIVHYTHLSRDYVYMEALAALIDTQPNHADYTRWMNAVKLYADYLKKTMKYVSPYGMLPCGVYNIHEIDDRENFMAVQVWMDTVDEQDFEEQMQHGVKLDKEHVLRIFPVWYSFKGNTTIHLSTGKNAAICARLLHDEELKQIAEEQLQWIVGKNPFGQSLMYGEGSNYAQQYTALPGETVGEIPVGIQTYFNEDEPYWPQFNTATYKEVWLSSAARWLMLIAEF